MPDMTPKKHLLSVILMLIRPFIGCPVIQKAKCEYSPFGKVFHKGLDESDKTGVLLKRLKNIEDKSKEQLKMIENEKSIN